MSYFRLLRWWGEEDSNLRRLRQQIYSLPHLTALEPAQLSSLQKYYVNDRFARVSLAMPTVSAADDGDSAHTR